MTILKYFILGTLWLAASTLRAQPHPIVPQPQQISYGESRLRLAGADIGFASSPSAEDRFAARQLALLLGEVTGSPIEIREAGSGEATFVLERTGPDRPLPLPDDRAGPDSREAYRIAIDRRHARITSPSSAGLFYAVQTLRQLVAGTGPDATLPECRIRDWPAMAYRGFMMDMSHTQLPRMEEIKRQLDFLARWKANQYYFYSEASIELEGYPLLMADARFTPEQVREVIAYARARHIDVIPNLELYGHIHDLFRLEHYADLAVVPHGGEFRPYDERVKPIVTDWVTQLAGLFPSPYFHIGFDETWLIEREARQLNLSPEQLYLKMLNQTTDIVEAQGKIPMVYADMLQKYPSIIPEISPQAVAVAWHYFPKDEPEYGPLLKPFAEEGNPLMVQSASINWEWVYPAFDVSFANIDRLITVGRNHHAAGFIHSGWTDDTQTIMRLVRPDMAYGAIAAWQSPPVARDTFYEVYTRVQYPAELAALVASALRHLEESAALSRQVLGHTDFAFFANPFTDHSLKNIAENRETLRRSRLAAEKAQVSIREALTYDTDSITMLALLTGARMLDYLTLKYIYAGEIAEFWRQLAQDEDKEERLMWVYREVSFKYHTRTQDMLDAITELKKLYRRAWSHEYETFRLGVGLGKYDLEFQRWLKMQIRMEEIRKHYNPDKPLPSLEALFE